MTPLLLFIAVVALIVGKGVWVWLSSEDVEGEMGDFR